MMISISDRWQGFQSLCLNLHKDGCHFLTLITIAEEYLQHPVDLVGIIRTAQSKGWIRDDFYVTNDGTVILNYLTGKIWKRKTVTSLPVIKDNDYTEVVYYNPNTGFHHFRRRYVDTLSGSITVRDGYIEKYYIYTVGE